MEEPDPLELRAAMAGDTAAFERLVRRYQEPVFRFLCHLTGNPGVAEDVAQETFLRIYRRLPGFRYRSKFSTWVFQIAHNAGVDAMRSASRRERLLHIARPPPPATEPVARAEIHAALASLSPKLRQALLVVEVLGLSYREAGQVLGAPEGTVKSRVHQARQRLVDWLEEERAGEV